jgi:hypothetical protein
MRETDRKIWRKDRIYLEYFKIWNTRAFLVDFETGNRSIYLLVSYMCQNSK